MNSFVNEYFSRLIQNGFEGQDRSNIGGMRLWKQTDYLSANSQLVFYNENVKTALKNHNGTLFTVSRVELDQEGNPRTTSNGKHVLVDSGLLYHTTTSSTSQVIASLEEVFPECRGSILPLVDVQDELIKSNLVREVGGEFILDTPENTWPLNFMRCPVPIGIQNTVFLPFPSGRPGSTQIWGYRSNRQTTSRINSIPNISTAELPF